MTALNILPECYVDTKVAEMISQSSKYNHQHGCGQIANQLKNTFKNKVALGIIDEDRDKGPIANYFLEFIEVKSENGLILKRHTERAQYLILICPEIEEWLLNNANFVEVDPIYYNLPKHLQEFKHITKKQNINTNIGFYQFIKTLLIKEAPGIITLRNWIEAFKENNLHRLNN